MVRGVGLWLACDQRITIQILDNFQNDEEGELGSIFLVVMLNGATGTPLGFQHLWCVTLLYG